MPKCKSKQVEEWSLCLGPWLPGALYKIPQVSSSLERKLLGAPSTMLRFPVLLGQPRPETQTRTGALSLLEEVALCNGGILVDGCTPCTQ